MKKKKSRRVLFCAVLLALVAAGVLALSYVTGYLDFGAAQEVGVARNDSVAWLDGEAPGEEDAASSEALEKLREGVQPALILEEEESDGEPVVALAFYGSAGSGKDRELLSLLKRYQQRAVFFVQGMQAAENSDWVAQAAQEGHEIEGSTLYGESQLHTRLTSEVAADLARSRQVLTALTDEPVERVFLAGTDYTEDVCRAAAACGYTSVVTVDEENCLGKGSFSEEAAARRYVKGLTGDTVILVCLDGAPEAPAFEPVVEPDYPAVDKQPDAEAEETGEAPEETTVLTEVEWLLKALEQRDIRTASLDEFRARSAAKAIGRKLQEAVDEAPTAYRYFLTEKPMAALVFRGIPEEEVLSELSSGEVGATFYVTGVDAREKADALAAIRDAGFEIGNGGLTGEDISAMTREELYEEIVRGGQEIDRVAPLGNRVYLPCEGEISEDARLAAKAAGYSVLAPDGSDGITPGSICCIDVSAGEKAVKQALFQARTEAAQAGISLVDVSTLFAGQGNVRKTTDAELKTLREANHGAVAEELTQVRTTRQALSFLFSGVRNGQVAEDVLEILERRGCQGTFFVTYEELQTSSQQIEKLIASGQEIGIAYEVSSRWPDDFDSVVRYVRSCQEYMDWKYGITTQLIHAHDPQAGSELPEAVSALGCTLVGYGSAVVHSEHENLTPAGIPELMEDYFSHTRLTRGSLVYWNMDYYQYDRQAREDTLLGEMLEEYMARFLDPIAYTSQTTGETAQESRYRVVRFTELCDPEAVWTAAEEKPTAIALDKNVLTDMESPQEQSAYIADRYIGTPDISSYKQLPGFSDSEIRRLDKKGVLTGDKVLFLTFDDWGTDLSINPLLYVLRKHDVKATFFVRTNHVEDDPNLLRAIAQEGHAIASHTDAHLPLANYDEDKEQYFSLSEEEAGALREDLVSSYEKLYAYVGDVTVDGVPALTTLFRPPTLAVSREGLYQVFDVGFTYSVSGYFSTHDYAAGSVQELVELLSGEGRFQNGGCIVMHMTESACYTAEALDILIPLWKEQGYQFARADTYLTTEGN